MTSEARIDTLVAKDGSSPTTLTKQSAAKATANFDDSSDSIEESTNVSSVTFNSSGDYNVNFSNNFANTAFQSSGLMGDSTSFTFLRGLQRSNRAVDTEQIQSRDQSGSLVETDNANYIAHGTLA